MTLAQAELSAAFSQAAQSLVDGASHKPNSSWVQHPQHGAKKSPSGDDAAQLSESH